MQQAAGPVNRRRREGGSAPLTGPCCSPQLLTAFAHLALKPENSWSNTSESFYGMKALNGCCPNALLVSQLWIGSPETTRVASSSVCAVLADFRIVASESNAAPARNEKSDLSSEVKAASRTNSARLVRVSRPTCAISARRQATQEARSNIHAGTSRSRSDRRLVRLQRNSAWKYRRCQCSAAWLLDLDWTFDLCRHRRGECFCAGRMCRPAPRSSGKCRTGQTLCPYRPARQLIRALGGLFHFWQQFIQH